MDKWKYTSIMQFINDKLIYESHDAYEICLRLL